jgi:2-dehydro-3-deoxyphosphogluconate aldolase / (4S)-4-hydroxy-2-oxoglutarate aldolase
MNKTEVCQRIKDIGIIPAIRVSSAEDAHFAADSVAKGGIPIVEITMTVPEAVELITHLVKHHQKMTVGAGTVLDVETARRCIDAGAAFITAPGFDAAIVEFTLKQNLAVLPGALTPTEVITAWHAGADFVKVFPCAQVGGDKYIRSLKSAVPQIPLVAAGGVTQQSAGNFIFAGAIALGVGSDLIPVEAIEHRESERIKELSHRFLGFVKEARRRLTPEKQPPAPTKSDFTRLDKHLRAS